MWTPRLRLIGLVKLPIHIPVLLVLTMWPQGRHLPASLVRLCTSKCILPPLIVLPQSPWLPKTMLAPFGPFVYRGLGLNLGLKLAMVLWARLS